MLGCKIKEYIAKSNHIIIKYLGIVSVNEAYAKQRQLFEELEQLIEKANKCDELEEDLKTQSIAFQEAYVKFDKDSKYIELGKAIEWAFENNYAVVTFDDYQEVDKYIGTTEELKKHC